MMQSPFLPSRFRFFIIGVACAFLACTAASADIIGLNNLAGWQYNQSDAGASADLPDSDTIRLTNGESQARSIFFETRQSVSPFIATFTYQATNVYFLPEVGLTFTLQNDLRAAKALGSTYGYAGITPSAAVVLGVHSDTVGYYTGGVIGGGASSLSPVALISGNPIDVTIAYDGTFLSVDAVDSVTQDSAPTRNYIVGDLASVVGGTDAYVGFTAGTNFGADQFISNFEFRSVPEPASLLSLVLIGLPLIRRR